MVTRPLFFSSYSIFSPRQGAPLKIYFISHDSSAQNSALILQLRKSKSLGIYDGLQLTVCLNNIMPHQPHLVAHCSNNTVSFALSQTHQTCFYLKAPLLLFSLYKMFFFSPDIQLLHRPISSHFFRCLFRCDLTSVLYISSLKNWWGKGRKQ